MAVLVWQGLCQAQKNLCLHGVIGFLRKGHNFMCYVSLSFVRADSAVKKDKFLKLYFCGAFFLSFLLPYI